MGLHSVLFWPEITEMLTWPTVNPVSEGDWAHVRAIAQAKRAKRAMRRMEVFRIRHPRSREASRSVKGS